MPDPTESTPIDSDLSPLSDDEQNEQPNEKDETIERLEKETIEQQKSKGTAIFAIRSRRAGEQHVFGD